MLITIIQLPGLQVHCKYTAGTLLLHCKYTAGTLQLAVYTANTLQNGLLWQHFVHCTYTASKWQCTCSVRAAYTAAILPVHSTSVWGITLQCAYSAGCVYPFYPLQTAVRTVPTLWQLWAGTTAACSGHCIYTVLTLSFWVLHCSPTVVLQCTAAVGLQWV